MTGPAVPGDDADQALRDRLAQALHFVGYRGTKSAVVALLPIIRAYADQRAAKELLTAADDWERDDSPAGFVEDWLRDRADALTAREAAR